MAKSSSYQLLVRAVVEDKDIQRQLNEISKKYKGLKIDSSNITKSTNSIKDMNTTLGKTSQSFKEVISKVGTFGLATATIGLFTQEIRRAYTNILEMNKALTEFSKVSDLNNKELQEYGKTAAQVGQDVARTGSEIIQAASEFRKSNFGDRESLQLAKIAAVFQNVADSEVSAADAASLLISQMKAFGIQSNNTMKIIDGINEVSNKFAVSSTDLTT